MSKLPKPIFEASWLMIAPLEWKRSRYFARKLIFCTFGCALGSGLLAYGNPSEPPARFIARLKSPGPCAWTKCAKRAEALEARGLRISGRFSSMRHLMALETVREPQARNTASLVGSGPRAEDVCKELMSSGLFEYVEPDYAISRRNLPNDSAFVDGRLWGLRNTGQSSGVSGADIAASEAWKVTTGSREVVVGILDAGIRYSHLDLRENIWTNDREIAGNNRDDDGNGYIDDYYGINAITGSGNPMDDDGHGTHVAGTIAASANGGGPHVGVAWNAQVMALKFLDRDGYGYTSDAVECLDYAISKGVDIVNASWGSFNYSRALFEAVRRCSDAGILVVAAAGNESVDNDIYPSYPANFALENVVSVAAIDRRGALASFSNYGARTVHLTAPGVSIFSSIASGDQSYEFYSGTSMAAPHVAGVAALLRSVEPTLAPVTIRQLLMEGSTPAFALSGRSVSGGMLNARGALAKQAGQTYQPPVLDFGSPTTEHTAAAWRQGASYYRDLYYREGNPDLGEAYFYYYEGMAQFVELHLAGRPNQAAAHYYLHQAFYQYHFHRHYKLYASAWYYYWSAHAFGYYYWCLALSDTAAARTFYNAYMEAAEGYYYYLRGLGYS